MKGKTGRSAIGNIWASGLAWAVIPNYGWRPYVVLCAAPLLPAMILRLKVKESPRYLLISGEAAEAAEVIVDIARGNQVGFPPLFLRFSRGNCRNCPLFSCI